MTFIPRRIWKDIDIGQTFKMAIGGRDAACQLTGAIIWKIVDVAVNGRRRASRRLIAAEYPNDDADDGAQKDDPLPQPQRKEDQPIRPQNKPVGAKGEKQGEEEQRGVHHEFAVWKK